MNSQPNSELNAQALLALRGDTNALRLITERLGVKAMGPADHIRTKHEVKAFLESGNEASAETLLRRANERREIGQTLSEKIVQRRGQKP